MNAFNHHFIAQESSSGGGLISLLPFLLLPLLAVFAFMPQRKEKQRHAAFIDSIEIGDDVVSSGGLHGTITFIEGDLVHLEVDSDVVIRLSKASLARMETPPTADDDDDAKSSGDE